MAASINVSGQFPHTCISVSIKKSGDRRVGLAIIDASEISSMVGGGFPSFYVNRIIVPEFMRGKAIGTELMQTLANIADDRRYNLYIDPTANYGSNVPRLIEFFARFGFVATTGPDTGFGRMVRKV